MKAIGAKVEYWWGDETVHPEAERQFHTSYISFGGQDDEEAEFDSFGIPDDEIFFYVKDEQELKDYMEYPTQEWILSSYEIVYQ